MAESPFAVVCKSVWMLPNPAGAPMGAIAFRQVDTRVDLA